MDAKPSSQLFKLRISGDSSGLNVSVYLFPTPKIEKIFSPQEYCENEFITVCETLMGFSCGGPLRKVNSSIFSARFGMQYIKCRTT